MIGADSWWQALWRWAEANTALLGWLFVLSLGSLVLCALLLPIVVVRLPADYFSSQRVDILRVRTLWSWSWHILKNLLGVIFVLAGLAMLVLPGQGLLTILIGLLLLDFPGKRRLERKIVSRPAILRLLNAMRERRGHAPLITD